jgi:copper chaperone CopZ
MNKQTLQIPNISCGHCVKTIENELNDLTGVNVTESDISAKTVTVKWDDPATLDMIKNTLNEINYPAQ